MIGEIISHYKILEKLGEGGMGVVYKAEDLRLKRDVAIKFLPRHLGTGEEDRERFKIEARAAAALNHPNIATIHAIEEVDDNASSGESETFIVMEYIDGQELKQRIINGRQEVDKVLTIASQIADGLHAAHEKGVTHCDIKSTNIMLTNHHRVKIMDFGLAKIKGQMRLARTGTTGGTIAYMSPEQARGEEVDHRTDIWSFGVVLYEMITGHLPFTGEYEQAIVYSILNEEPEPASGYRDDVPMDLERIVTKALAKNPAERYQHMDEMLVDLRSVNKVSPPHSEKKKSRRVISKPLLGGLALMLLITILILAYLSTHHKEKDFQITHTQPLTTASGLEQDPAWSPEGTRIAYASDESGNMDVWVKQIAAGQKLNLTGDYSGYDGKPVWSPDGEWIAFISERNSGGIFMLPALGGIPKQVNSLSFAVSLSRAGSIPQISWSPDGSELAYAIAGSLYTISATGGDVTEIPLPSNALVVGYLEPAWSPNGERIACTGFLAEGVSTAQIWSVHRFKPDPVPVTEGTYMDNNPVWAPDGKSIYFISDRGGGNDVWWLPVDRRGRPTGSARPLTTGVGISAISLSKDGTRLVYTKSVDRSNIWSVPMIPDRISTMEDAVPLTSENHFIERLDISPDGEWLTFDSNRRGNMDIWIMRKDGTQLRQLTSHPAHDWTPRWSPDGKKILFHSIRSGNRDLFIIPVTGGAITQLTDYPTEEIAGNWSPDGQSIGFVSNRAGNMDIWQMSVNGEVIQQVTFHEAPDFLPEWAPDGNKLAFSSRRTGYYELFIFSEEQILMTDEKIKPTQITNGEWGNINACYWTEDGQTIYAYGSGRYRNQGVNLWTISLANGAAKPLLDLSDTVKEPLNSLQSDGERLYFPLWERIGDLWIAEVRTGE